MFRLLVWVWLIVLVAVVFINDKPGNKTVFVGGAVLATVWTGVTVWAARDERRLGSPVFAVLDGVVVLLLSAGGAIAGAEDFFSGGYPMSWLFVVAYAANLRWTMAAAVLLAVEHTVLHFVMELGAVRTAGTIQFLVFGLLAGWAFDNLRLREQLRLDAQRRLAEEQRAAARHEERARLAERLHDSFLQTLHAIGLDADDPAEVRYLTRRQERELRRTIEEFRSPHERSFRAELLTYRDEVEDLYRWVNIVDVIRDDTAVTPSLAAGLAAAREALLNAAKHSGADRIDLYSEITDTEATIHVRDRGRGFNLESVAAPNSGMAISMIERVEKAGGQLEIDSAPGVGTEVTIRVPTS